VARQGEVEKLLLSVFPPSARVQVIVDTKRPNDYEIRIAGQKLRGRLSDGRSLSEVKAAIAKAPKPSILILPRLTPAVRELLDLEGIGWIESGGSVRIVSGSVVVQRDSVATTATPDLSWAGSVIATAEALLTGVAGTVAEISNATGMAPASAAKGLRSLTAMGLLKADAIRGRHARRHVINRERLLGSYVEAVLRSPRTFSLQVGVLWRDPITELAKVGQAWTQMSIAWAATGALEAAVVAPLITQISPMEVYIDAHTPALLAAAAQTAGLEPIEGGRLTLRPFPRGSAMNIIDTSREIPIVPWSRAYADLQTAGVRGEEAAEHLKELMSNADV